jgi:ubiquinone/menaquinone biosynthesis C-methylase UbiE
MMTLMRRWGLAAGVGLAAVAVLGYAAFGAFLPWREAREAERLADLAAVAAGTRVADVGAGTGRFTEVMARRVGARGLVYSTEISADNREAVRRRVEAAGLTNVTIVEAAEDATNLPDGCCEVVFLRNVYHHIGNPDAFAASLRRAVRDGGRLAVIDFEPGALWFVGGRPGGAAERRRGHGVDRSQVRDELTAVGFRLEREIAGWSGPLWLMLFRPATSAERRD